MASPMETKGAGVETQPVAYNSWQTSDKKWYKKWIGVEVKILSPEVSGNQAIATVYTRDVFSRLFNFVYKLFRGKNDDFLAKETKVTVRDIKAADSRSIDIAMQSCFLHITDQNFVVSDRYINKVSQKVFAQIQQQQEHPSPQDFSDRIVTEIPTSRTPPPPPRTPPTSDFVRPLSPIIEVKEEDIEGFESVITQGSGEPSPFAPVTPTPTLLSTYLADSLNSSSVEGSPRPSGIHSVAGSVHNVGEDHPDVEGDHPVTRTVSPEGSPVVTDIPVTSGESGFSVPVSLPGTPLPTPLAVPLPPSRESVAEGSPHPSGTHSVAEVVHHVVVDHPVMRTPSPVVSSVGSDVELEALMDLEPVDVSQLLPQFSSSLVRTRSVLPETVGGSTAPIRHEAVPAAGAPVEERGGESLTQLFDEALREAPDYLQEGLKKFKEVWSGIAARKVTGSQEGEGNQAFIHSKQAAEGIRNVLEMIRDKKSLSACINELLSNETLASFITNYPEVKVSDLEKAIDEFPKGRDLTPAEASVLAAFGMLSLMQMAINEHLVALAEKGSEVQQFAEEYPLFNPKRVLAEIQGLHSKIESPSFQLLFIPVKLRLDDLPLKLLVVHCLQVEQSMQEVMSLDSRDPYGMGAVTAAQKEWKEVCGGAERLIEDLKSRKQFATAEAVRYMVEVESSWLGDLKKPVSWFSQSYSLNTIKEKYAKASERVSERIQEIALKSDNIDFLTQLGQVRPDSEPAKEIKRAFVADLKGNLQRSLENFQKQVEDFDRNSAALTHAGVYSGEMEKKIGEVRSKLAPFLGDTYKVTEGLLRRTVDKQFEEMSQDQLIAYKSAALNIIGKAAAEIKQYIDAYNRVCKGLKCFGEQLQQTHELEQDLWMYDQSQLVHSGVLRKLLEESTASLKRHEGMFFFTPSDMDKFAAEAGKWTGKYIAALKEIRERGDMSDIDQLHAVEQDTEGKIALRPEEVAILRSNLTLPGHQKIDQFRVEIEGIVKRFAESRIVGDYIGQKALDTFRRQSTEQMAVLQKLKDEFAGKPVAELTAKEFEAWEKEIAVQQRNVLKQLEDKFPLKEVVEALKRYKTLSENLASHFEDEEVPQVSVLHRLGEVVERQKETLKMVNATIFGLKSEVEERIKVLEREIKNAKILGIKEQLERLQPGSAEMRTVVESVTGPQDKLLKDYREELEEVLDMVKGWGESSLAPQLTDAFKKRIEGMISTELRESELFGGFSSDLLDFHKGVSADDLSHYVKDSDTLMAAGREKVASLMTDKVEEVIQRYAKVEKEADSVRDELWGRGHYDLALNLRRAVEKDHEELEWMTDDISDEKKLRDYCTDMTELSEEFEKQLGEFKRVAPNDPKSPLKQMREMERRYEEDIYMEAPEYREVRDKQLEEPLTHVKEALENLDTALEGRDLSGFKSRLDELKQNLLELKNAGEEGHPMNSVGVQEYAKKVEVACRNIDQFLEKFLSSIPRII